MVLMTSSDTPWTQGKSYRPDIDGLRAVAVLAVVLFHAFPQWVKGGFVGVDIFFVISGYLITSIILDDLEKGAFSLRRFYENRIIRIFPALILVLFAAFAFGWFELLAREYAHLARYIVSSALFFANILALRDSRDYFNNGADQTPLLHLWTLGVEEQFYIVWPLMLVLFYRAGRKVLLGIGVVGLASFALNAWLSFSAPTTAFYSPLTRFFELMMGGYLAHHAHATNDQAERGRWRQIRLNTLSVAGVILIGLSLALIDSRRVFPGWWVLLPTIGTALLIQAGPTAWINRHVLGIRPLVWIGLISFPLYLWHWPLLSFAHILEGGTLAREIRALCVVVAFVLAWLTYRYVEIPVRLQKYREGRKRVVVWLLVLMGIVAVLGVTVHKFDGIKSRISQLQSIGHFDAGPTRAERQRTLKHCPPGVPDFAKCLFAGNPASERVLVLGDSHGAALVPGMFKAVSEINPSIDLVSHSIGGCSPLQGVESYDQLGNSRGCRDGYAAMYRWAIADSSVRKVFLVSRWAKRVGGATGFGFAEGGMQTGIYRYLDINGEIRGNSEAFTHGLRRTVRDLTAAGKQVFFVHQVPEFGFYPPFCGPRPIPLSSWREGDSQCTIPIGKVADRQQAYRALVESVIKEFPEVTIIEPLPVFCNSTECSMVYGSAYLYQDDDHVNDAGAYKFLNP